MKILFLCVANSARSQIAEGLAKQILGGNYDIRSAGSKPAKEVNPLAIQVLAEIGVDISRYRPKNWEDLPPRFVDRLEYVINLCAEESCPTILSKAKRLSWALPDPVSLESFRNTREEIKRRLEEFKSHNAY